MKPKLAPPCGIYYLWDGERVLYVGKSTNVRRRLREHARAEIPFIQAFFDPCTADELDSREMAAIREFRPTLNIRTTREHSPRLARRAPAMPRIQLDARG
jgi:excinuclease UvrABC nuclease subunit